MLPILTELIQTNLRDLLVNAAATDPLHTQLESEIKAQLAQVNLSMKNLLDAVKAGALSMEQIKEDNAELQDAKRRLERRLETVKNVSRVSKELAALVETFDRNFDGALAEFVCDLFRFNMFIRLFFSELTVEIDRSGFGWRKGKKKGELPPSNPRMVSFTLDDKFDEFVEQTGLELPIPLKDLPSYSAKRSERQGSRGRHVAIGFDFTFFQVVAGLLGNFIPIATGLDSTDRVPASQNWFKKMTDCFARLCNIVKTELCFVGEFLECARPTGRWQGQFGWEFVRLPYVEGCLKRIRYALCTQFAYLCNQENIYPIFYPRTFAAFVRQCVSMNLFCQLLCGRIARNANGRNVRKRQEIRGGDIFKWANNWIAFANVQMETLKRASVQERMHRIARGIRRLPHLELKTILHIFQRSFDYGLMPSLARQWH